MHEIIMKVSSIKTTVKEAQCLNDDKKNRTESCSSCNPVPPGELKCPVPPWSHDMTTQVP